MHNLKKFASSYHEMVWIKKGYSIALIQVSVKINEILRSFLHGSIND